jgi:hypothetical protein
MGVAVLVGLVLGWFGLVENSVEPIKIGVFWLLGLDKGIL